jgi:hypothetical protein
VVNTAFVGQVLGARPALSARLTTELGADPVAVVGVVGDVTPAGEADRPAIYLPMEQLLVPGGSLLVRTEADPRVMVEPLVTRLRAVAPTLALDRIVLVADVLSAGRAVTRFNAVIAAAFAALALGLAAIGVYGLTAGEVAIRRRELAIRVALGARDREALRTVIQPGATALLVGAALGIAITLAIAPWTGLLLHGVGAADPATLALVPTLLGAVGLGAALLAGQRALRPVAAGTLTACPPGRRVARSSARYIAAVALHRSA